MKEQIVIFHHDCEGRVNHWSLAGEIVRCKDCKHNPSSYENGSTPKTRCPLWCGWCFNIDDPEPDFFCAYGERREE